MGSSPREGRCVKVITLGPSQVGKSCLILKATDKDFVCPTEHNVTIGVDFKILNLQDSHKSKFRMHIWDTAGQEKFHQINRMYYREVAAVIFVFDLTRSSSLEALVMFWEDFQTFGYKDVFSILVGTKSDLQSDREVTPSDALAWANRHSMPYLETSAMTGLNIDLLFTRILNEISSKFDPHSRPTSFKCSKSVKPSKKRFFHC